MYIYINICVVDQLLSHIWLLATPWTAACQAPLSSTISQFSQIHVHWVGDAIQPSHPLLSPPPTFNLSQHQGLTKEWVLCISGQSIGVSASASVLPVNIQDWFPLGWTGGIFSSKRRVFSNTTVQKHQFFGAQLSL